MRDTIRGATRDFWARPRAAAFSFAASFALTLALAGCAETPTLSYNLHAAASVAHVSRASVSIDLPDAAPPLDSDTVVVRQGADGLSSLAGAQWADRLTLLVQSRTLETFENAGLAGEARAAGAPADKRLALDIRRFDIDAPTREARVEISARLIADSNGRTLAAKIFSASEPVAEISGPEPPVALDRAFHRVLPQIVAWAAAAR